MSKKKDLNKIAQIEKAMAKKYGTETIVNPKSFWDDDKEKEYLEQLKEFYGKEPHKEKVYKDGFLLPKNLITKENKRKEYPNSPSGMPGVQTIFPVMLDHVNNNKLTLEQLIKLMCENPCRIFGIKEKGFIKENFDADLTIVDLEKEQIIKDEMIASKCGWTPFNNYKVKGFPIATIVNGTVVMENGKIVSNQVGKPLDFKL